MDDLQGAFVQSGDLYFCGVTHRLIRAGGEIDPPDDFPMVTTSYNGIRVY